MAKCSGWRVLQRSYHLNCIKHKSVLKISHSIFRNGFEIVDERSFISIKSFTVLLFWSWLIADGHHRPPLRRELEEEVWNFGSGDIIPFIVLPKISVILFILLIHYCPSFYYCYFIIRRNNHSIINWFVVGYSGAHSVLEYLKRWDSSNKKQLLPQNFNSFSLFFFNKYFCSFCGCFRR